MEKKTERKLVLADIGLVTSLVIVLVVWGCTPDKESKNTPKASVVPATVDYTAVRASWTKECISLLSGRSNHSKDTTITDRCLETAEKLYPVPVTTTKE